VAYRDRLPTWQRALDDARELAALPASAFAGRIPTVRRAVERLESASADALAASAQAPVPFADPVLAELIAEIGRTLLVLRPKLTVAEQAPDIVVRSPSPPSPSPSSSAAPRIVIHPPPAPKPAPSAAEQARLRQEALAAEDRARLTKRGWQLRFIELCLGFPRHEAAAEVLRSLLFPLPWVAPPTDDDLRRALEVIEPSLREAKRLLDVARHAPEPSTMGTDEALAESWRAIIQRIEDLEEAIPLAKERLSRSPPDETDPNRPPQS
jgi:hypothetical protein